MGFADEEISVHLDFNKVPSTRDQQLLSEAQAGSSVAFGRLQRIYWRQLYATVLGITKNREDAEDALQDTFLRAYVALPRFEGRSTVYSWLTRIAINSALMILRKRRVRSEVFFDSPGDGADGSVAFEIKDGALNPEQIWDQRQQRLRLLHAVQKLDPKLRAPVQILLANDYSMKEIATTLNISVSAVKARLHRARARLSGKRVSRHCAVKDHPPLGTTDMAFLSKLRNREQPCIN